MTPWDEGANEEYVGDIQHDQLLSFYLIFKESL